MSTLLLENRLSNTNSPQEIVALLAQDPSLAVLRSQRDSLIRLLRYRAKMMATMHQDDRAKTGMIIFRSHDHKARKMYTKQRDLVMQLWKVIQHELLPGLRNSIGTTAPRLEKLAPHWIGCASKNSIIRHDSP